MANNLRVFNLISDYNETELMKPSVSFVVENGKVYYDDVPSPTFQGKWLATYLDSHIESAECDISSAITDGEIDNTDLVSVEIGDCVTSIGYGVFQYCSSLTSCTIGSGVTSIGASAFRYCLILTSIDIPNSVTSIGNNAFRNCSSLTSIDIPSGVTEIGFQALQYCSGLTAITCYATTPPTVQVRTFSNTNDCPIYVPCESLAAYQTAWSAYANRLQCIPTPTYNRKWFATLSGDVITSGECDSSSALTSNEILIGTNLNEDDIYSVEIGDCVTTLPNSFLNSADRLSSCTIPDTVTSIGTQAFYYCKNLKRINSNVDGEFNIPSGITSISDSTFNTCIGLTNVTIPNTITSIGNNAFKGCTNLSSMTIPNSVTSIGFEAFRECTSLPSITIPSNVQTIDNMAFSYCSGATACTIGSGLTSLPDGTFYYCTGINTFTVNSNAVVSDDYSRKGKMVDFVGTNVKDLIIGEGVTSIGIQAFLSCTSLTSVTIPNSVTSIGNQAFRYSSSLQSITVYATTPPTLGSNVFDSTNDCPIYVPSQSVSAYQTASGWSSYSSRIQALT